MATLDHTSITRRRLREASGPSQRDRLPSQSPCARGHRQRPADLWAALDECRAAADQGFQIARAGVDAADIAIKRVSRTLQESIEQIANQNRARTSDVVNQLEAQLRQINGELHECQAKSRASLEARSNQLHEFSIALFGRTMVGKSTLMEILTQGDGASIGKGAQRTTRDVRTYNWRGLKVTDVPGVAAFEGHEDEELAFEAAAKADLVIFLISDDAPQPAEAELFARVRALGKPLLGICNVKVSIEDDDDLRLFLRSQKKWFDKERLNTLLKQFYEFADRYTPGYRAFFVWTHLLSKFLAIQPTYYERRHDLERASRFRAVKDRIISEVIGHGKFLRVKNFIDGVVAPTLDLSTQLLNFSERNSTSGRVLVDKIRQVRNWAQTFERQGHDQISTFISTSIESMRDGIPSFSEDNYDRDDAGERWSKLIKDQGIERKVRKLLDEIVGECQSELSEFARQINVEVGFANDFVANRRISMDPVFDSKRAWKWGTTILTGSLTIGALLASAPFAPVLGVAALVVGVVGLLSFFFEDREEKVRKQRRKLDRRLNKEVDKIERKMRKNLGNWFTQELLENQVRRLLNDLLAMTNGLFTLADRQRELAWILNRQQKKMHRILLLTALRQLERPDLIDLILDVARLPGFATMLVIKPRTEFPADLRRHLKALLGEQVWFVLDTGSEFSVLKQAIGRDCDPRRIRIEKRIQIAHIPVRELDAVSLSRIRLAQQLTELHITK